MNTSDRPQPGRAPILIGGVAGLAAIAGILFWWLGGMGGRSGDPDIIGETDLSISEKAEIYRQAQRANAMLENEYFTVDWDGDKPISGYEGARRIYSEISAKIPNERLPYVNEAISRFQYVSVTDFNNRRELKLAAAEEAITAARYWREQEPKSAEACWLLAQAIRIAHGQLDDDVVELLLEARDLAPENPIFQWSVSEIHEYFGYEDMAETCFEALESAYQLTPTNMKAAVSYALALCDREDARALSILEEIQADVLLARNARETAGTRSDPLTLYEDALNDIRAGDFRRAKGNVSRLGNVLGPLESYKNDGAELLPPNALVFMEHSLDKSFQQAAIAELKQDETPVEITLGRSPVDILSGLSDQILGEPVAFEICDFDLDIDLEILLLTTSHFYVIDEPQSSEIARLSLTMELPGDYQGILVADLDRDSLGKSEVTTEESTPVQPVAENETDNCDAVDVDIVFWGTSGIRVYRNDLLDDTGKRALIEVPQQDDVLAVQDIAAAILIDIEADADLDLILSTEQGMRILLHQGESIEKKPLAFREHTATAVLPSRDKRITSLKLVDWDRDVDVDVLTAGPEPGSLGLLENLRLGRFRWRPLDELNLPADVRGPIDVLEADGNVSWDLIVSTESGGECILTATSSVNDVRQLSAQELTGEAWNEFCLADLDNNGVQDVIAWTGASIALYRGDFDGSYTLDNQAWHSAAQSFSDIRQVEAADFDDDGDLDIAVLTGERLSLFLNDGGNQNHWIVIRAFGDEDNAGHSNHSGIGALLELKSGGRYQAQTVQLQRTHFGLGKHAVPDVARFIWTNGMPQGILDLEPDTTVCQVMYLKGSCPFIYTWTGERYEFLTDCLWAAPLGLQKAEGVLAPSRSWEYLLIPGERLVPIQGEYRLQLTEELWEAAYFDEVKLVCIDHPADVEVFSNEKVGPAFISEFMVHTVAERQRPVAARDQMGRDVMDLISAEDQRFMQGFDRIIRQGRVPAHHLEIDLGTIDREAPLTLFLTGWIQPTDTSLNIALSQNPEIDAPELPSIWIADATGEWQLLPRPMGFPGGKTKTIAVDLTDAFPTADCRLQIRTTAEIYWDEVFFTNGKQAAPFETTRLEPVSADLHYRGFSRRYRDVPNGPELFDYSDVETEPRWAPMRGNFTRYGDVLELLREQDDMMAILGSGDEMTVAFDVPESPLRKGWKRDFFLYSVGWDKDADLNTIEGQTVEPLPHQAMTDYPPPAGNEYPNTPEHQRYLETYQTRQAVFGRFWNHLINFEP